MSETLTLDPGDLVPTSGLIIKQPIAVRLARRDGEGGTEYWTAYAPELHVSRVHGDSQEQVLGALKLRIGSDFESAEERDRFQLPLDAKLQAQREALYAHISRV